MNPLKKFIRENSRVTTTVVGISAILLLGLIASVATDGLNISEGNVASTGTSQESSGGDSGGFSLKAASIVGGCSGTSVDFEAFCYESTNDHDYASAQTVLYMSSIDVLENIDNGVAVVEPGTSIKYKCVEASEETETYFVEGKEVNLDFDFSSTGIGGLGFANSGEEVPYRKIPNEGELDVDFSEPTNVQIACVDWDGGERGSWAASTKWAWYDEKYRVAKDSDLDGVYNVYDECSDTRSGLDVNDKGCLPDSDGDGVKDYIDRCPETGGQGYGVNDKGCPIEDSDGDGVTDPQDECLNTPEGEKVDSKGCEVVKDTDNDGVINENDRCPERSGQGYGIKSNGCPKQDSDGDGALDSVDDCPDKVGSNKGCPNFVEKILYQIGLGDWVQ